MMASNIAKRNLCLSYYCVIFYTSGVFHCTDTLQIVRHPNTSPFKKGLGNWSA